MWRNPVVELGEDPTAPLSVPSSAVGADTLTLARPDTLFASATLPQASPLQSDTLAFDALPALPAPLAGISSGIILSALLLLSFFLSMAIVIRFRRAIELQLRNFFRDNDRNKILELRSQTRLSFTPIVYLLCSVQIAVLYLYVLQSGGYPFSGAPLCWYPLAFAFIVAMLYCLLKHLFYAVVNHTFFTREQRVRWHDSYSLISLLPVFALFLYTLVILYTPVPLLAALITAGVLLVLVSLALTLKARQIFFAHKFGVYHFILYFCALEIAPLLLAWVVLREGGKFLVKHCL